MNVDKKTMGVNFDKEGNAEVQVFAPMLEKVELVIYPEKKNLPLLKDPFGYWKLKTDVLKPGALYKFRLNGEKDRADPASLFQPEGVHGPSQACDLHQFRWSDEQWKNPELENYLIYELHAGTFSPEGNFEGIENKLDYLVDLGITAVEIMPVAQFPGSRNWGYDGVFPYAVQNSYGGATGLQKLVNACHRKGLAVILDVVYNHVGPEGNYLGDFGGFFTEKYHTPWGDAINLDDAWCDGIRKFFVENVLMWFRDFHVDALRMDAVHAIKDFSPKHILQEIREAVDLLKKETGREHHLIVELDLNDVKYINSVKDGGYGMDAQWIDEFHHALRVTAGEPKDGYYADFEGIQHLAKSYKDAYVFDGIYSIHRHKTFGVKADNNPGKQFIVFSQNHDHVGNRMLGERTSELVSFEMLKLMAGAVLVSPYIPLLFMGEEYGEVNPFQYFVSHSDKDLIEAVRKGRKQEFAYFHEQGEAPDPQATETFEHSKLNWDLPEINHHRVLRNYYKALISLRKENPVLKTLDRHSLDVRIEHEQLLILHRWNGHEKLWIGMNFSRNVQEVQIADAGSNWNKIFDSADLKWFGPGASPDTIASPASLKIHPESLLIYHYV